MSLVSRLNGSDEKAENGLICGYLESLNVMMKDVIEPSVVQYEHYLYSIRVNK